MSSRPKFFEVPWEDGGRGSQDRIMQVKRNGTDQRVIHNFSYFLDEVQVQSALLDKHGPEQVVHDEFN